jgi:hypothetical protein
MAAEVFRVFGVASEEARRFYEGQFFDAEQAYQGTCTAKTTIYNSNIVAGFAVAMFTKWLRDIPIEKCVSLNLLTMEISVED